MALFDFLTKPITDGIREIKHQLTALNMKLDEAFTKLAADDAQLKKALGEVRTNTDTLIAEIAKLKDTDLTPEQEAIVNSISTSAQGLDDVVPDAPEATA